jgi:hypothetical protein
MYDDDTGDYDPGTDTEEYSDVTVDEDGTEVEIIDEDAGDGTETEIY